MYRLVKAEYDPSDRGGPTFDLRCEFIHWDGNKFGLDTTFHMIPHFKGVKAITDLPIYPQRYAKDLNQIKQQLIA
jgi:hypothetical protein